jgi:hypothetical protein
MVSYVRSGIDLLSVHIYPTIEQSSLIWTTKWVTEHSILLSTRTSFIVSYWTLHIIHCNGGSFKDDDDDDDDNDDDDNDNKEHIFSNLHVHLNFLSRPL